MELLPSVGDWIYFGVSAAGVHVIETSEGDAVLYSPERARELGDAMLEETENRILRRLFGDETETEPVTADDIRIAEELQELMHDAADRCEQLRRQPPHGVTGGQRDAS